VRIILKVENIIYDKGLTFLFYIWLTTAHVYSVETWHIYCLYNINNSADGNTQNR